MDVEGYPQPSEIIAAAWRLYADLGIDKVRTEDVADAAGVSASAVIYHFRTKDQLLQAALRHSLDVIAETRHLNDSSDPIGVLRHFARIHAGVDPKIRRVWSIWLQCWARRPPTKAPERTSPPSTANGWT